jgi:tRNA(His) 5'-end guanylyltransferase
MNKKDSLGDRMKTYESVSKSYLTRKTPVIIRLDGCHFHTFTKGFIKPFDSIMKISMQKTMKYLCSNIMGCVLGYTQSDEITLVLCDYKKIDTQAWFDNQVQKICSVSASMATFAFNKYFSQTVYETRTLPIEIDDPIGYITKMKKAVENGATFDSRCFNIPKEEVCNCLIWRQLDATRNSIQSLAQSLFSHKELQGLNCDKLQDKIFTERGINWNNIETTNKRGSCCIYTDDGWIIDNEIPIFTQDRNYIESRIIFKDE